MKKTRLPKSWSKHNIPAELWPEILSRLPVKSLLRFRCVSKSWQSLIDDPDFCRLHLNRFKNNCHRTHLFVVQGDCFQFREDCIVRCSNTFKTTARIASIRSREQYGNNLGSLPAFVPEGEWEVVSSIDGLVMLTVDVDVLAPLAPRLLLWNPSIRKFQTLPPGPKISNGMTCVDLGLGFDPLTKDYKHVRLVLDGDFGLQLIAVFSVGTGSWKTIHFQGKGCSSWCWTATFGLGVKTFCFRGYLCFIATNRDSDTEELVSFDLSSKAFASTSLPVDRDVDDPPDLINQLITVDGGCSLMKFNCSTARGSVWVLETSRGDSESMYWSKCYSFTMATGISGFLYLKKNGDMLLSKGRKVTSYNLETQEEKLMLRNIGSSEIIEVRDYIESLMLLK